MEGKKKNSDLKVKVINKTNKNQIQSTMRVNKNSNSPT